MAKELDVSKSTIYFKINLIKFLEKHLKASKKICKENGSEFK